MTTVAAVIIGDEILSGKVRDTNAELLISLCQELGATLQRVVYISDDPEHIATEVARCAADHDVVITSGGVGPTHDDRTVEGVARAFGVRVVRDPAVATMIQSLWGRRFTEGALRMADMPAGGRLVFADDGLLPVVAFRNVFLLPGIPQLFAVKVRTLRAELTGDRPLQRNLYLTSDESRVAPLLGQVDHDFPAVKIGSYPTFGESDHRLWVTVEGTRRDEVDRAVQALLELLPPAEVVRLEDTED